MPDEPHAHEADEHPVSTCRIILSELKSHAPFTALGALSGIALMAIVAAAHLSHGVSKALFDTLHPIHVLLSAQVTAAIYHRYKGNLALTVVIGYVGSVGIGTLSDIVMPHLGGLLVGAHMDEHMHIGFIDRWYVVNPLALLGVAVAIWRPSTKLPHGGHVFISTWASLFYLTAHGHDTHWLPRLPAVFAVLFFAVWLPCCLSDIVFPLLFVGKRSAAEHGHDH